MPPMPCAATSGRQAGRQDVQQTAPYIKEGEKRSILACEIASSCQQKRIMRETGMCVCVMSCMCERGKFSPVPWKQQRKGGEAESDPWACGRDGRQGSGTSKRGGENWMENERG